MIFFSFFFPDISGSRACLSVSVLLRPYDMYFSATTYARDCDICCRRINPFVSSGLLNTLCLLLLPTGRKDWGICVWVGYV